MLIIIRHPSPYPSHFKALLARYFRLVSICLADDCVQSCFVERPFRHAALFYVLSVRPSVSVPVP